MKQNISTIRSITAIFWLGFFVAISFMEAPLKFTAPNLSMAEGLQIGKIIFGALNKCEWFFLFFIVVTAILQPASKKGTYLIIAICAILIIETAWLLPLLNDDANRIVNGKAAINPPYLHWLYVVLELIKAPVLLLIGLESRRKKVAADGANKDHSPVFSHIEL